MTKRHAHYCTLSTQVPRGGGEGKAKAEEAEQGFHEFQREAVEIDLYVKVHFVP